MPVAHWQRLEDHLAEVSRLSSEFAEAFHAADWGAIAGQVHDAGKYSAAFQQYIKASANAEYHDAEMKGKIDHTSAGAQHVVASLPVLGHLLAFAISGHHAGLLDAVRDGSSLENRLAKRVEPWSEGLAELPPLTTPQLPEYLGRALGRLAEEPERCAFSIAFFTRMVFSCLVDADFLDTERFVDPERASSRPAWQGDVLGRMARALATHIAAFGAPTRPVDVERARVHADCLRAAELPPGFFSLTVPTGGGKTLSSLAFALNHAVRHGLDRIVYVAPFTTIIEQNAAVFRDAFSKLTASTNMDFVVEHHSAIDVGSDTFGTRLSAENWDAPLVVTTSVQLYESLFANRPSRCRKLHNLARSVIVLDEAQKLPVDFLRPCLMALEELSANYGASVVLCTATQPAVHRRPDFPIGIEGVREIIPDPPKLYRALKRVDVDDVGHLDDKDLSSRVSDENQVLCIVNTRRHARALFDSLSSAGSAIHLSAAMCAEHRSGVVREIRTRLSEGAPCRVISTQLVEAGVDLDFPVVYRSLAGLDSIAQAAGRCNRNGTIARGHTHVFRSEHGRAERFLRDTTNTTAQILGAQGARPLYDDLLSLEAVEHYFRLYYWEQQHRWDAKGVIGEFKLDRTRAELPFLFNYRSAAERFRLIEDTGAPVVVSWGDRGRALCDQLRNPYQAPNRMLLRALQRFTVQIPRRVWNREVGRGLELVHERFAILISPEMHYDPQVGLDLEPDSISHELFII